MERSVAGGTEPPPGLIRAEETIERLKQVDIRYAPDQLKSAIIDYIAAAEKALDGAKAGRDTTEFDKAMGAARQRMIAATKKYG
jgi:hypothetical protein